MAKWKFEGIDKYIAELNKLADNTDEYIGKAVYQGAGLVADAAHQAIRQLATDDGYHKDGEIAKGPPTEVKEALDASFGISKMRNEDGYINVKLGFKGKNPNGLNNSGAARQIESGTSWMAKQPFISRAINHTKKQCEETMAKVLDEEIKKLTG